MTLVQGPWSAVPASPEDALARVLARPDGVRSVHRPIVDLLEQRVSGYQATVRVADWAGRDPEPAFRAAAGHGLADQLAAAALGACLRGRATLPGERFLVVTVDPRRLAARGVQEVLEDEDDVADLVLLLDPAAAPDDLPPGAGPRLAAWRARGLRLAVSCGDAGAGGLDAVRAWGADIVVLPETLVRGVADDPVRQRLVGMVADLVAPASPSSPSGWVIADGVESPGEARALVAQGVRFATGWLFGRPRSGFQPAAVDLDAVLRVPRPRH